MSTPVIGLTTYGRDLAGAFSLPADYCAAITRAGGTPVLLPPTVDPAAVVSRLDGLLLAGGGDLDPRLYGGPNHETVYMVDAGRDTVELGLARHAIETDLPCLCICRGIQVLNVALGGSLIAHLPEHVGDGIAHRVPPRRPAFHEVEIEPDSRLSAILGTTRSWPASWHHQALNRVGSGLVISARAADGTVEGVELAGHPWLVGVQWHPEITADHDPVQQALFDGLIGAARRAVEALPMVAEGG